MIALSKYFVKYNGERPYQALSSRSRDEVYKSSSGGGALIVDKYDAKGKK